ncbi:hypothetical protein ACFLS9_09975, partial [Bacteroidota bacterium]
MWRKKETVEVCRQTFKSVMNMFNSRENFTYSQSQAVFYNWMKDLEPELFDSIKSKVNQGRWEIVGGMWVEPDCNLIDGVSWSRQFLYGQKYFEKFLGVKAKLGWNPDSFGYNRNMPEFLLNGGVDAFITQKIGWNDTNVFPYRIFWWESPQGNKLLTYFPFNYVNDISDPYKLVDWLRQFEANTGFTKLLILFGVGNHGGGPSLRMMERIDRLNSLDIFPKIEYGTAGDYVNWLRTHDLNNIPVWRDELYLEYHRGTFTTHSETKKFNRDCEVLLTNAEKYSAISNLYGFKYHKDYLDRSWKNVLFNQFHDILPGTSIKEVYIDSKEDYEESEMLGNYVLGESINNITSIINTSRFNKG